MKYHSHPSYKIIVLKIVLVLGLFPMANSLFGQFPPPPPLPGVETLFETQTEIDDFAEGGLGVIFGNIRIADNGTDPITNLDGLSLLNSVIGNVVIEGNEELTSYCGLVTLLELGNILGSFEVVDNFWNPTTEEILEECEFQDPEEELSLAEILQAFLDDGVLNKGQVNSLSKQATKSLKALSKHLAAFARAGILTEDEAALIFNSAESES
jgi:hypothetical protein